MIRRGLLVVALASVCLLPGDPVATSKTPRRMENFPRLIVWVWERPEDLRFIDTRSVGVAFLARTFTLSGDQVFIRPRLQPLRVAPGTALIAVARIESDRFNRPSQSVEQSGQLVQGIAQLGSLPDIRALQVDFDARASERDFYRAVLVELRPSLPESLPLSITALASWCLGDNWLDGLPIDEAVPMLFEMGPDTHHIQLHLESGRGFSAPVCDQSVGVSADERFGWAPFGKRLYVFRQDSWSAAGVADIFARLRSHQ